MNKSQYFIALMCDNSLNAVYFFVLVIIFISIICTCKLLYHYFPSKSPILNYVILNYVYWSISLMCFFSIRFILICAKYLDLIQTEYILYLYNFIWHEEPEIDFSLLWTNLIPWLKHYAYKRMWLFTSVIQYG